MNLYKIKNNDTGIVYAYEGNDLNSPKPEWGSNYTVLATTDISAADTTAANVNSAISTLAAYKQNNAPTNADSVAAIKALITVARALANK